MVSDGGDCRAVNKCKGGRWGEVMIESVSIKEVPAERPL